MTKILTASLQSWGPEEQRWKNVYVSSNSDKIVFNQHPGGGSVLYLVEYETHVNILNVKGAPVRITNISSANHQYDNPRWQLWNER